MACYKFHQEEARHQSVGLTIALAALHATVAGRFYSFVFAIFLSESNVPRSGNASAKINYQ
jgi:hypothetical protein